jgi:hypothetical protein
MEIEGVTLTLKRSPEKTLSLTSLLQQQHNPRSLNYGKWVTASEYGAAFGPSKSELERVKAWARSSHLTVTGTSISGQRLTLSGTASALSTAFSSTISKAIVGKFTTLDFSQAPSVPASLGDIVAGVAIASPIAEAQSHLSPMKTTVQEAFPAGKNKAAAPQLTMPIGGSLYTFVTPHDLAHVYNADTLWPQGITGVGQTIAVVARDDVRDDDWISFRSVFGLPQAALQRVHPGGCQAPTLAGKTADDTSEPTLDVEWAGAAAPGATIQLASCANVNDTNGNLAFDGLVVSIRNLVDSASPPNIISFSYATCEQDIIGSNASDINEVWTQAAAEGIAVIVGTGDVGGATCAVTNQWATRGRSVNGFAASPHVVAVGGTEFSDEYKNVVSQYWDVAVGGTPDNGYQSALSYIPEMAWNASCMNPQYYESYASSFSTREKFCYSGFSSGVAYAGGGGPSQLVSRPVWQAGVLGLPAGAGRVIPDVALFAADATFWRHGLVVCLTDPSEINPGCEYNLRWGGGTSFATPAYAGIQALINQRIRGRQGTPAYSLYQVARLQYNGAGVGYGSATTCNAELGTSSASGCVFHDVTLGETTLPCFVGTPDCFAGQASNQLGRLATDASGAPAYPTTAGWDYATGLGSVNVANLVAAVAAVDAFASLAHVSGDTNGDGFADITLNDPTRQLVGIVSLQSGRLLHTRYESLAAGSSITALGDINSDGSSDPILVDPNGSVVAWISEGEGGFNKLPLGSVPAGSHLVGTGDFNGDGFDDLIFDDPADGVASIWLMSTLSSQTITRTTGVGSRVAGVGDLDGDGLADLAVLNGAGQLSALLSLPDNSSRTLSMGSAPSGAAPIGAADLNADRTSDLIFFNAQTSTLTAWMLDTSATRTATTTLAMPAGSSVVSVLDLDGNRRAAVVAASPVGVLIAYRRDPSGNWDSGTSMSSVGHPWIKPGASVVPNQGAF